jgi:uncharacterized protein YjdB
MKAKILFALAALLMLGSVSLNAQEVGNSSNSESTTQLEGDLNHDNKVDVADVTYLVNLIMKNQSEAKDGMYYWYIGVDNPTTISNIQTENTKAGWHEIGTSLDGFVLDATNTDNQVILNTENVKYYYYVVIPNNLHIYDSSNTNNVEELYFESATCNIAGYKVLHYKIEPGTRVVKGIIIKENIPVSGVSISTSESSINVGNTLQLEATVSPSNATNKNVTWSSSNPEIATVDETTGLVTGVAIGTTTIIATSVDGSKTATTRVEVVDQLSNYYWYIGVENPSSISNVQTDNTIAGWHNIGSSLTGFKLDTTIKANKITVSETDQVLYYVIIPNELNIYDSNEDNGYYMFNEVTCNITGYKAYQYNVGDGVWYVRGIIIK